MKIIHIVSDLNIGGVQRFCSDLSNYQKSAGHEVDIFTLIPAPTHQQVDEIKVSCLGRNEKFWNLLLMVKIFLRLKNLPSGSVVHTHGIALYFCTFSAVGLNKIRFVHTIHNLCNHEAGFVRRVIASFLFRGNFVDPVTISGEVERSYLKYYQNDRSVLIENGVPTKSGDIPPNGDGQLLTHYNIDAGDMGSIFINVGRFDYQKNRKLLFDVFEVYSRNNNAKLIVAGGDVDLENSYYLEIKDHIGVKRGSIVLVGNISDVSKLYSAAQFFILSSRFEGLPLALLEAMQAGLICISTPAGGCGSVLRDVGFVSEDFEFDGLYNALSQAIFCDKKLIKERTINHFIENFTLASCAARYQTLYLER